ncbi:MAG: hypothetical protein E6H02_11690 [Bacillati bacterium ANGP1]|uniref:AMP-dependent synthetase/ligase domain-containing protein n=1 Tax=Candidatus Segetimicrobium genomatis TaxID=2569760 RepID=A0A537LH26_9BACT|nr:MAG: hypothetical protein E6H02_11690 [Terrabacteria group bacterium ANGP1]
MERDAAALPSRDAAETPGAVAVVAAGRVLTYQELDTRANHLAHELRALGVGPDVVVGLCVKSSPEMVVGALAILKAGGAYLPLDPAYPDDRLAFILGDARCPVAVTAGDDGGRLAAKVGRVVTLDPSGPRFPTAPAADLRPENLAYVIYTSGSTGQPKGVEIIRGRGVRRRRVGTLALPDRGGERLRVR